ncbi:hypothetical protein [Roseomonas sp. CECT 9278]|uniref:hypothetical protein n=1 Tax=Roseomonas sp. CECT 9278 TaxID=2845823 RepID=UPI001E535E65|nr:hypothetical protein [Roseomonas sp. CECT 9278]CAH0127687.1 hypothetical protein ROS9278_00140 [Roseomonas sp. CECT 9278]
MSANLADSLLALRAKSVGLRPAKTVGRWGALAKIARRLGHTLSDCARLRALVNGEALCASVDPNDAWAINVSNFVWGHYIVTRPADDRWLAFNLVELAKFRPQALNLQTILHEICSLDRLELDRLLDGGCFHFHAHGNVAVSSIKRLAITIPAFNAPDLVEALLLALQDNALLFGWKAPIVLFDGSSTEDLQRAIERLAVRHSAEPCPVVYLGRKHSSVAEMPSIDAFVSAAAKALDDSSIEELFSTSVGGNLNCCFSYFGPDVSILNFDHDVLPSVEVNEDILSRLETSCVASVGEDVLIERGEPAVGLGVQIPVDFMSAIRVSDSLCLTGDEVRDGDDESYRKIKLHHLSGNAEYWVTHIAGIQDHSARWLLEGALLRRESLRGAEPSRFAPTAPTLPALVFRSKLITTTLTLRLAGGAGVSFGFAGTRVRVQDFVTGTQHNASTGQPIGWAPVYMTHNRKFGMRGEEDFGGYLYNEEIMYAFLSALEAIEIRASHGQVSNFADVWKEEAALAISSTWARAVRERAQHWCKVLEQNPVDASYSRAARSIRNHFMLDESDAVAEIELLACAGAESNLIERHVRTRERLNTALRERGVSWFCSASGSGSVGG